MAERAALEVGVCREEEGEGHDADEQGEEEHPQEDLTRARGAERLVRWLVEGVERRESDEVEGGRLEGAPDEHEGHEHRADPSERL